MIIDLKNEVGTFRPHAKQYTHKMCTRQVLSAQGRLPVGRTLVPSIRWRAVALPSVQKAFVKCLSLRSLFADAVSEAGRVLRQGRVAGAEPRAGGAEHGEHPPLEAGF